MVNIKEKDFVEMEYTGRLKENEAVFDTTDETIAKDEEIHNPNMTYGPVGICIGEGQLLEGLDEQLIGKEVGKEYTIDISSEKGFGKKDAKLLKIIPTNVFKKENIMPQVGMQVNIDGLMGVIKTVSGGRTIVDFNHPLSGKELVYKVKLIKVIADDKEKVSNYVALSLNIKPSIFEVNLEEKKAKIKFSKPINTERFDVKRLSDKIKELVGLDNVEFEFPSSKENTTQK